MDETSTPNHPPAARQPLSAVVISYNRADIIGTCLRALSFADELILIDKSSTDETPRIASLLADRVMTVAWSPTVEETREFAVSCARHEWILLLDDDECLSVEAVRFIEDELRAPRADVYALPQRHYILGRHDEAAYYWPEFQPKLFRRGSLILGATVHGGMVRAPQARLYAIPPESGVCMHHLSHKNVAQWIEKTNRYTGNPDRLSAEDFSSDLPSYAHRRIDAFVAATKTDDPGGYPAAVAVLRALYDIIDRLKRWESESGIDGDASFQDVCRRLEAEYDAAFPRRAVAGVVLERAEVASTGQAGLMPGPPTTDARAVQTLQDALRHLRTAAEAAQRRAEAEADRLRAGQIALEEARRAIEEEHRFIVGKLERLRAELTDERRARRDAEHDLREVRSHVERILGSTSWRITRPLRAGVEALRDQKTRGRARMALLARGLGSGDPYAREILRAAVRRRLGLASSAPATALSTASANPTEPLAPYQAATASYAAWSARFDTPLLQHREWLRRTADDIPPAGILCFFREADAALVERTAAALRDQVGLRWTASFLFAEGSDLAAVAKCREHLASDRRFLPAGVLPQEDILVLVQEGALPRSHGPRVLVEALARRPSARLAYGDEDRLDGEGVPHAPWFKPRFSELLLRQGLLLGLMVALRVQGDELWSLIEHASRAGPAEAIILTTRLALEAGEVGCVHVPHVLFHDTTPVRPIPFVPPALPKQLPLVSVIIPTRNRWDLLGPCLKSLRQTDWPADLLEVIVVDNGSDELEVLEELRQHEAAGLIRVERDPRPFNYARLNNTAVRASRGSLLVFLNNDTEAREPSWLRRLAALALRPGAGAVGAKLLYGDGTVQHGGVILGVQGAAGHAHLHLDAHEGGYMGLSNVTREVSAVTGACLAVTRDAFDEAGGFDEDFRVAFNDVVLCLNILRNGRRNVYLGEPIITHHESKTRGYDDTQEKTRIARHETCLAWLRHAPLMRDDPYYSPNLSLEEPYALSLAPRRRSAWRPQPGSRLKVMMLSLTHGRGHGVAVVIDQQVSALAARGHEVVLAGYRSPDDFPYGGRPVLEVHDPQSAATLALDLEVDVIVAHTPPFFNVARWTGTFPPVISYDYGEPPPDLFPDAAARQEINDVKNMDLARSTAVYAISQAVADEALAEPRGVLPLANSHLGRWDANAEAQREVVRAREGWADNRFVVLNVCRFGEGERRYKGVDTFATLRSVLYARDPDLAERTVFVLCGKGTEEDVAIMREAGLEVRANVTDEEMGGLYAAADAYANFSLWEGYNLGIGQALAMGLPVIASDIPAHRAFGVPVCRNAEEAAGLLAKVAAQPRAREAMVSEWRDAMDSFVGVVEAVASEAPGPDWFPAR
jgi:GT2 family glycosyltransferase/glycosyltransferase involved in cell wall biosynthesis